MDPKTTVRALMDAIQEGDFEKALSSLSGDFSSDACIVCMVLTWHWVRLGEKLRAAFPDLDFGFHIESVDGNTVRFSTQIHGTQTRDLDLTMLTIGLIPATNKSISTEREYGMAVVRAGKVISWEMESGNCATLNTILEQLGETRRWQLGY